MLKTLRSFSRRHRCLAGLLCILLLCFGATLQVSHGHQGHQNHSDCSLCVTAHAVVDIVILPSGFIAPVIHPERSAPEAEHPLTRLVLAHPLWNRPPPTSPSVA